ncbi:Imm50 family immunity protein [Micromonospora tulbaghiae]|uniref:Imm50 family immunity protein n=1 Tax=Micromonospora tulbaghiae TaxID=479978 RepID=UPI0033AE5AEF
MFVRSRTQGLVRYRERRSTMNTSVGDGMEWISALSNPNSILAVYRSSAPTLAGVRIHEVCLNRDGPTLRLRFDLGTVPDNLPEKWRREGLNVVQLEVLFGGLSKVSLGHFSTDAVCDLEIRKGDSVRIAAKSDSISLAGVAETATVVRISAYADSR